MAVCRTKNIKNVKKHIFGIKKDLLKLELWNLGQMSPIPYYFDIWRYPHQPVYIFGHSAKNRFFAIFFQLKGPVLLKYYQYLNEILMWCWDKYNEHLCIVLSRSLKYLFFYIRKYICTSRGKGTLVRSYILNLGPTILFYM